MRSVVGGRFREWKEIELRKSINKATKVSHINLSNNNLITYIFFAAGVISFCVIGDGNVIHQDIQSGSESFILYF